VVRSEELDSVETAPPVLAPAAPPVRLIFTRVKVRPEMRFTSRNAPVPVRVTRPPPSIVVGVVDVTCRVEPRVIVTGDEPQLKVTGPPLATSARSWVSFEQFETTPAALASRGKRESAAMAVSVSIAAKAAASEFGSSWAKS
jgi:hypothetical protein